MRLPLLAILIFTMFFCLSTASQTNENAYSFATISTENGLSNNIVYDILQDKEGYVWIATDNGLNRYDGYTVKKFFHREADSTSISSNVIKSLIEDLQGNIWIGTRNGLNMYDRKGQHFKQVSKLHNAFFLNAEIRQMNLDRDGRIWLTTLNGVGFFDTKTHRFRLIYSSDINPYISVSNENIWITNEKEELWYYNLNSGNLVSIPKSISTNRKTIHFGGRSIQLRLPAEFVSDIALSPYKVLPNLPDNIPPTSLLEVDERILWIGSNKGLFEYDYIERELKKIDLEPSTLVQQIRAIYKDKHGGIWVGTLGGVYHYDPYRKVFGHLDLDKDSDDVVMGLFDERSGIYANTLGEGMYYISYSSEKPKKIDLPKTFPDQGLYIWDIEEIRESAFKIWMATNEGLLCLDPITSNFQKIKLPFAGKDGEVAFSISNTEDDYLWLSTHRAIHRIAKKEGKVLASFSLNEFVKYSNIQKIIRAEDYIFIATEGEGLFTFHLDTHKVSKVSLNTKSQIFKTAIWDLYVTGKTVWIGTNKGLYNLSLEEMVIKPVLEDNQIIFSIEQDDSGVLWMGSDKGIKTYDPSTQSVRYYSTTNGLKNKEFNRKSILKTANGNLWLGGVNGITYFDPNQIKRNNPNTPYVHITNLKVITADSSFSVPHFQRKVVLPWNHNTIEIAYVGLNYTNASQNSYRYQMEGYDPSPVNNGKPSKARYVQLPVGNYTFNVEAANNDGIWNTEGDVIEIEVMPPIWRTKVAYVVYVLTFLGLIQLFRLLKKYHSRVKEIELEKEQIAKKVEKSSIMLHNKSKIYLNNLKYIKSDGNYLEFVTTDKTIIDRNKLKEILDDLPPNFVRVHRSYVINKNFIEALNSTTLFLKPNIAIPLSRTFKSNLA